MAPQDAESAGTPRRSRSCRASPPSSSACRGSLRSAIGAGVCVGLATLDVPELGHRRGAGVPARCGAPPTTGVRASTRRPAPTASVSTAGWCAPSGVPAPRRPSAAPRSSSRPSSPSWWSGSRCRSACSVRVEFHRERVVAVRPQRVPRGGRRALGSRALFWWSATSCWGAPRPTSVGPCRPRPVVLAGRGAAVGRGRPPVLRALLGAGAAAAVPAGGAGDRRVQRPLAGLARRSRRADRGRVLRASGSAPQRRAPLPQHHRRGADHRRQHGAPRPCGDLGLLPRALLGQRPAPRWRPDPHRLRGGEVGRPHRGAADHPRRCAEITHDDVGQLEANPPRIFVDTSVAGLRGYSGATRCRCCPRSSTC